MKTKMSDKIQVKNIRHFKQPRILTLDPRLPFRGKYVALIGAPGAGKTVTISKLAARMYMAFEFKIGLITVKFRDDCNQNSLKSYADLMQFAHKTIEISPGNKIHDIKNNIDSCLNYFTEFDLVFIDFEGMRPGDIFILKEILNFWPDSEKLYVLSAAMDPEKIKSSLKLFSQTEYERFIVTNIDRSACTSQAFEFISNSDKPLAYITEGERIPQDIEPASRSKIEQLIKRIIH